jgi:hypothetical protein
MSTLEGLQPVEQAGIGTLEEHYSLIFVVFARSQFPFSTGC